MKRQIKINDYVFASKFSDEDPNDPWFVGFVDAILEEHDSKKYKVGGRFYKNCRKISAKEGKRILTEFPKLEIHSRMNQIKAPFTKEQVIKLNEYQHKGNFHPFTCGGEHCVRSEREDGGLLIATEEGWICPCGKYKQDWCHSFMVSV